MKLEAADNQLLLKQIRRKKLSLIFCIINITVAATLLISYALLNNFTAAKCVVILLLLIGAKNQLRIYRLSTLLEKLKAQLVS